MINELTIRCLIERLENIMSDYDERELSETDIEDLNHGDLDCIMECLQYRQRHEASDSGWIPVSERLPELHDDKSSDCYLITNGIFIWMGYLNFDKEWVFAECTNAKRVIDWIEITAWQPLPEPYRRGNE